MQPVCQFVDCNRKIFGDGCCDLHYVKTCRALKGLMPADEDSGQLLDPREPETLSWIFLVTLTGFLLLVGLTVYRNHPLINGNQALFSFIRNKRKREEEERLTREVDEFNARAAPFQAKAAEARTSAARVRDRKKQIYEAALEKRRAARGFKECHEKAVAALNGSASPALATLKQTVVEASNAYGASNQEVARALASNQSAAAVYDAEVQKIAATLEEDIRTLAGMPNPGPVVTEPGD